MFKPVTNRRVVKLADSELKSGRFEAEFQRMQPRLALTAKTAVQVHILLFSRLFSLSLGASGRGAKDYEFDPRNPRKGS